eukprot:GFYU01013792.1.p1 GENE.GFYU01013792.1~~GFYU01013792.1.p1  ORF type:complete len:179 (+),score=31.45 GFYU01013792.1:127-663(+)
MGLRLRAGGRSAGGVAWLLLALVLSSYVVDSSAARLDVLRRKRKAHPKKKSVSESDGVKPHSALSTHDSIQAAASDVLPRETQRHREAEAEAEGDRTNAAESALKAETHWDEPLADQRFSRGDLLQLKIHVYTFSLYFRRLLNLDPKAVSGMHSRSGDAASTGVTAAASLVGSGAAGF